MTPSGPIVVRSGEHITGLHIVGDGRGPVVRVERGAVGYSLRRCKIESPAPEPDFAHPYDLVGIAAHEGGDAVIEDNEFVGCSSGLYAHGVTKPLRFANNVASGIRGPFPRGQLVQLNACIAPGIEIIGNTSIAGPDDQIEDHISFFKSGGTTDSWARVEHNLIAGGRRQSGCGITLGDGGTGGFVRVRSNRLGLVANAGINIVGGAHYEVTRNLVYSAGTTQESMTGVCVAVRTLAGEAPSDIVLIDNRGLSRDWAWRDGSEVDGLWTDGTPVRLTQINNDWRDRTLTLSEIYRMTTTDEEKAIAEREALLAAWRQSLFFEDMLAEAKRFAGALQQIGGAQLVAAQSVAEDAKQMRQAAERAPAAAKAASIAELAVALFNDRFTTNPPKGVKADEAMLECVRLATYARSKAEAP
jgi:HPt (histidine-containing phosphotransfer) domain-containing protein